MSFLCSLVIKMNKRICALNTHMLKYLYLCAGPLCGWAAFIDRCFVCVCTLAVCICAASPCLTFRRILLVCGRSMQFTDSVQVRWKERLLVEIPLFATRLLCWSTLLRVIVHNVTSIDWSDRKRQPEREDIFLSQTVFFWLFYLAPLRWLTAWNRWIVLTKDVCTARHQI